METEKEKLPSIVSDKVPTLTIKEKKLGVLITNAEEIRADTIERLKLYTPERFEGDAKAAAHAKAELNNGIKMLNDSRIQWEREFMSPFAMFKDVVDDTIRLMRQASGQLDEIVKAKEQEEKDAKKAVIQQMWNEEKFDLVPLDRVFNNRWLNKGTKITSVQNEIKDRIATIKKDLAALDAYGEDTARLKELYLTNLNIAITLQKGAELKANRERLAAMAAEREKQETETKQVVEDLRSVTNEIAEEVKAESEKKSVMDSDIEVKPGEWIFNCLCAKSSQYDVLEKIAEKHGLDILPAVTLKGTTGQLQRFKEELESVGFSYTKENFLTLKIKGEN